MRSAWLWAQYGVLSQRANGMAAWRLAVTALLLAAGLNVLVRYAYAMATTSLWTDELHTILHYSSRGPVAVLTEYHEPNNHVFFNLVNSLTPGRASVQPLRARIWSFAAVFATLAVGFLWFARQGAPEWGALFFCVLAIQTELLDLVLQARGYSFLLLFGLLASIAVLEVRREPGARPLVLLAVASVLGTWTVPTFVFFAGALWAVLLAGTRRRDVAILGVASALAIALLYFPIASQVAESARVYSDRWGREYGTIDAVGQTIRRYLLGPVGADHGWVAIAAGVVLATFAAAVAWRRSREELLQLMVVAEAVGVFFVACRALGTPLIRTTAFIVAPIAFVLVSTVRLAPRSRDSFAIVAAFGAVGIVLAARQGRTFRFEPLESWKVTAEMLHDVVPEGTPFLVNDSPDFLAGYLSPGYVPARGDVDFPLFVRGGELFLDTLREDPPGGRLDARKYVPDAVQIRVPQRRAGYQAVWFCPPAASLVVAARTPVGERLGEVTDRRIGTGVEAERWLELELAPGKRYRSLVVVTKDGTEAALAVSAFAPAPGRRALPLERIRRSRNVLLVPLGDRAVELVSLSPLPGAPFPAVQEAWAYPAP